MNLVLKDETLSGDIYSKEDCIIHINQSKDNLSEWVYKAYKLGEEDFNDVLIATEITIQTAYNYIKYEEAKESLKMSLNLNKSESSLSLTQGVYSVLNGKTPQEREHNFQEVYNLLDDLPTSHDIRIYNAIKTHAKNGEELKMVDDVFKYVSNASNSLQKKLWNSNSPYKLPKLLKAIEDGADESIIIGIADTGNLIPSRSSKADRERIRELEEEVTVLKNRLSFFENSLARKKVQQFMKLVDYTVKSLKKVGGDAKLIEALNTIGVEATVNEAELKKAYRDKVSIHHPDKGGDDAIFRKIIESNEIIKNHIRRITNG